ncbi:Alginate_exp domain-containing protein [Candidatus Nitrotoga sp. BS]|uniref:alginate export family protein n=1 Tax=Candidatus Nitrotoga sp. BS TaxID=2890408 RepID=UPI001EF3C110|nr:alginate export family protein [Candidatus Nitrotoga sp. BS]CAH1201011.1 Alginate_exp domain-containing protein [Candidatus Nitrotoga sp. BS]
MIKTFYYPLGKMINKVVNFKEVINLIEFRYLELFKIKMTASRIEVGILASSLLVASPYSVAQENMQLKPQIEVSSQEIQAIVKAAVQSQEITQENAALKEKKMTKTEILTMNAIAPNYYVESRTFGVAHETEPPRYVKQINNTWLSNTEGLENINWVDIGLQTRLRYEYRDNDFRRSKDVLDKPLLQSTRIYADVKSKIDPFRFTVEMNDSRAYDSAFQSDNRNVNKTEIIQGYGELYFNDALGKDDLGNNRPVSIKAGRMTLDLVDRRLIARNEWRNTINSFQGLRATFGQKKSDWQVDLIALQPIIRLADQVDKVNDAQWLYGIVGDWRKWSKNITLQPYYLFLKQDGGKVTYASNGTLAAASAHTNREIHTGGFRGFGIVENTGLDYDFNYAKQWGNDGPLIQDAYAYNLEGGYTAQYSWKPRFSATLAFASGDKDSKDSRNQRFDSLFGASRSSLSASNSIQFSNLYATKIRSQLAPSDKLKIDFGYSWYHLASATDLWSGGANLQDKAGKSGKNIGEEFDVRVRYSINQYIGLNVGYSHFMAGDFTKKTSQLVEPGRKANSNLLYVETTLSAF